MFTRLLTVLASLMLCLGCSRSHLQVQILGENDEPIRDVAVGAHGGPYFADVRGAFGFYTDEDRTDEDGIANLKLRIPYHCRVTADLPGYTEWLAVIYKHELVSTPEFVKIEPSRSQKQADLPDTQTITVWMRIRD